MSRKVFEYCFDPDDLEPFFSEIPTSFIEPRRRRDREVSKSAEQVENTTNSDGFDAPEITKVPTDTTNGEPENREENEALSREERSTGASVAVEAVTESQLPIDNSDATERATVPFESNRTRVRRLLSVHALGQYVFCLRSAILSAEKGDQRDLVEALPRYTYLPNFDRELIEEKLSAKITQLGFFALYIVCLMVLMKMGVAEQKRGVFYPSGIAFLGFSLWSLDVLVCIVELAIRRQAAIRAEAREPEPDIAKIERVNWWSMLKAGFEPINYEQPFQHPELPLEGTPWPVLQRGSRRIPVVKSGSRKLGNRKRELYPKHQVRLAAYALLLESAGHVKVPYGLAFPVDSPHGLALPITDELEKPSRAIALRFRTETGGISAAEHPAASAGKPESMHEL